MAKLFNEHEFVDPWAWCMAVIKKHELTSKQVAEQTDSPRSTVRALVAGTNAAPRYELLTKIIGLCISYETIGGPPVPEQVEQVEVAEEEFDFI